MTTDNVRRISLKETAKLVRQSLKAAFPKTVFSVRSKSYSGGSSIDVSWVDGPTSRDVEAIVKRFEGAKFDGMQDLKSYQDGELNGERVKFGVDYVMCQRSYSVEFYRRRAERVHEKFGGELVTVTESRWGTPELHGGMQPWGQGTTYQDLVIREAHKTRVS